MFADVRHDQLFREDAEIIVVPGLEEYLGILRGNPFAYEDCLR